MSMKLSLTTGPTAGDARMIGSAGAFVVGTYSGATWVLPRSTEGDGEVSISTDREGLSATLSRGQATLDGRPLGSNNAYRLGQSSVLRIAGHELRLSGAADTGGGLDAVMSGGATATSPTISSILADVSPGGTTAEGPLPGHSGEDILQELTGSADLKREDRPEWGQLGAYEGRAPEADPVEPSPLPPVMPTPGAGGGFLPDDWDTPDPVAHETQDRLEQGQAPTSALSVAMPGAEASISVKPDGPLDSSIAAFIRGAGLTAEELGGNLPAKMQLFGEMLRMLLESVTDMEAAQAPLMASAHGARAPGQDAHHSANATILSAAESPDLAMLALKQRLEEMKASETALMGGVLQFARTARDILHPETILAESRNVGGPKSKVSPEAAAFGVFLSRFAGQTNDGIAPLSSQALTDAIKSVLAAQRSEEQQP